jgi:NADH-quinone oxidoreductase subunit N
MNLVELFPYVPFTDAGFAALVPFIILGVGATLTLIAAPTKNGHTLSRILAMLTLALSAIVICQNSGVNEVVGGVLTISGKTNVLLLTLHAIGFFALFLLSGDKEEEVLLPESNALVVYAVAGMGLLVASHHLLFQFIAIEIMSLAVYVLVAMRRTHRNSAEAGMKYFILGGLASATFLYGSALLYGASGAFTLPEIAAAPASLLKSVGFCLVLGGLLFKVGAVPFHGWVPDVYEGAGLPVTGFMAAAVKLAAFAVLAMVANAGLHESTAEVVKWVLIVVAALTMVWGNFAALNQKGLKRLLAYSSIAHTGYLLVGVLAMNSMPITLYLFFYAAATLGAFACLQALAPGSDDVPMDSLAGRGLTHPIVSLGLTVFLFGMAGIPMTAGFIGKYMVFSSGVGAGHIPLVVLGVLTSVAATYYYLRVIVTLYMKPVEQSAPRPQLKWGAAVVMIVCLLSTLYFGIMPSGFIDYLQTL